MKALGIEQVDKGAIERLCRELLAANPASSRMCSPVRQQAVGALIGQARKQNPNVNPAQVREICLALILDS